MREMMDDRVRRALSLLGIDFKDGRSRVLRAIIASQEEMGAGCTFNRIRENLIEEAGGKEVTRPLIYRYLKSLEDIDLIVVDRNANPNRYIADVSTLTRGIDSIRNEKVTGLKVIRDRLRSTQMNLRTMDTTWLARNLIEMLVGGLFESGSRSSHGEQQISELIAAEIYSRARKDDLVRITLDWDFKTDMNEEKKRATGYALFSRGVKIRFLLHDPSKADADLLRNRIKEYKQIQSDPALRELSETRVTFKTTKTYQSVSLNRDGIVLIVSEKPSAGVWIPRAVNSKLVDDVINRFDEDFANAVDFLELEEKI